MSTTTKFRFRRHNGTGYDIYHPETEAGAVLVPAVFANPLNTDQLTLGMNTVYFKAYPSLKWCVDHLDGDYVYLGLYNCTETITFGSNTTYSGSTIATKCTTFLNNTIPNVSQYLENVTVHDVTNKVFISSRHMFDGTTEYGDDNSVVFDWTKASATNRAACVSDWTTIGNRFWLSSPYNSSNVWNVYGSGDFYNNGRANSYGFRSEVKVRYKMFDTLDYALDNLNNRIINGGTSAPTFQPVGGLWFEDLA